MKYRLLFLLMLGFVTVFAAGEYVPLVGSKNLAFNITDEADTASSIMFIPSTGLDSFLYHDSIRFPSDTTLWDTLSWTSPPQQMKITVGWDTAITYVCSLDLGTNIYGFEYDPSGLDDTTVALIIDNLVDSFNNVAGMKDTVLAEDSVSYIKLVSEIAQIQLEGDARWTAKVGDSLDTAAIWVTSVADVCDSMPVYINGLDSARFWSATDNDTSYTITGNKNNAGIFIFAVYTDTAQDTVYMADSVSSWSTDSGTVSLDNVRGFKHIDGRIIIGVSPSDWAGLGNDDSAIVTLYSVGPTGRYIITVDTCAQVPCTCDVMLHSNVGDTTLRRQIEFHWYVDDSVTDITMTIYHPTWWDLQLK